MKPILKYTSSLLVLAAISLLLVAVQLFLNAETLIDSGNIPTLNSYRLGSGLIVPSLVLILLAASLLSGLGVAILKNKKSRDGMSQQLTFYLGILSFSVCVIMVSLFQYLLALHGVQYD